MSSEQKLKAQARLYARTANRPDPSIGEAARAEAEEANAKREADAERVYKTQAKRCGTIMHRGSGRPMSEFSDPSAHTVAADISSKKKV
ncbi:hypothetical protein N9M10_01310 [Hellea sp.]|nr:hypothetical protein [Hellea sp.]